MVAILDANGNSVVQYTYDAWGKLLSTTGTLADTIGTINPLLYRGYIYDHDTGLYYLQSRYYNPTIERFINADAFVATGQGLLGNNMFAYCLNNPVYLKDSFGTYSVATIDDKTSIMDKFFRPEGSGGGAAYAASAAPHVSKVVEQEFQSWEEDPLNAADFFINSASGGTTLVSLGALTAGISIPVVGQWILGLISLTGVIWTIVH